MKCPKCGYLGFETSDRCRNCGYDFSLSVSVESSPELPLQRKEGDGVPFADFTLGAVDAPPSRTAPALDLDRLIGVNEPVAGESPPPASASLSAPVRPDKPSAPERQIAAASDDAGIEADATAADELPLFPQPGGELDDTPLITEPRPVRPPLAVRRATPDVPRGRSRTRVTPRRDDLSLQLEPGSGHAVGLAPAAAHPAIDARPAGIVPRTIALIIDGLLLATINGGVLYFTLAIAGLSFTDVALLPPIPLVAFMVILNGGYLIAFTTAGGQTIGKMVTGIRVMGDDGRRVDTAGAVLRAAGCVLTLFTLGTGYLPVLLSAEGRALHDRIAGTRVVKSDDV